MSRFIPPGLGWQRDLPDPRDYTPEHERVASLLRAIPKCETSLPHRVDLRADQDGVYFSPPDNQGRLNASPAFACLALVEYFQRKTLGQTYEGSPLFLYEMSRSIAGDVGNSGLAIRTTMKALKRYGSPPREMRPYCDEHSEGAPNDVSLLGFTGETKGMRYFRLDVGGQTGEQKLSRLKLFLAGKFPVILGFSLPRSVTAESIITYRPRYESYRGGQSVVVVGYQDDRLPGNQGALLIRSSWGTEWGDAGYGWLPYAFVTNHQVADLWTITSRKWSKPQ